MTHLVSLSLALPKNVKKKFPFNRTAVQSGWTELNWVEPLALRYANSESNFMFIWRVYTLLIRETARVTSKDKKSVEITMAHAFNFRNILKNLTWMAKTKRSRDHQNKNDFWWTVNNQLDHSMSHLNQTQGRCRNVDRW